MSMRATIARAISDRPVKKGDEDRFLNEELVSVVRKQRDVLNYETHEKNTLTSAGTGAYEEIFRSSELPTSASLVAEARVGCSNADGSIAGAIVVRRAFNSAALAVTALGVDAGDAWTTTSHVLIDARWNVDAVNRQLYLTVCDGAYAALSWSCVTRVLALEV